MVGAIQDGLTGDYEALATKAMLDGFASIALSATLGWGVALAAVTVLVYQGALSLGATLFEDILKGEALDALTSAGGVLIIGISLKLLDLTDVKVGNFLPALIIRAGPRRASCRSWTEPIRVRPWRLPATTCRAIF